ncbi:hypothetical protein HYV49_02815 [Candidatus Pacearchaeota archaeon]|nr:hypothetical protein [Candidatus Pacearchaeota archaeon]
MMLDKIPFEINFPLKILNNKKVNFRNKKEREKLFKRHIYYYKYGKIKNSLLEEREELFYNLAKEVIRFLAKKHSDLDILNISVFGSALYIKNPGDFDFLVIVKGNRFLYEETKLKAKYSVGISIKGIENFSGGLFDVKSDISLNLQSQVIYRTAISLFRRHIPIIGYDFINNRKAFFKNAYAQVSDLLNNAYELYYLKKHKTKLNNKERVGKILSRIYEAISYIVLLENSKVVKKFRKKIYKKIRKGVNLPEAKRIFGEMSVLYKKKIGRLDKNRRNKGDVLKVLLDNRLRRNIKERLENYWKSARLPYKWIPRILNILTKHHYNEDLAIKEVRKRFHSIPNKDSLNYSRKLENFRKIKVKNLAKRIGKDISGKFIADIGGRADDFVEQIIQLKKSVKKAYVTDLYSFTKRSKNPKIDFVVQSSSTKLPFNKGSINTMILSMVLHHLEKKYQKHMIKNLISSLQNKGKIVLIEDTYPKKIVGEYDENTKEFLRFNPHEKRRILYFYDWFGNRLMRNRDNIPLFYDYRTMEQWKELFEKHGLKQIKSEFIKENPSAPDIFPPKALMVFQKK